MKNWSRFVLSAALVAGLLFAARAEQFNAWVYDYGSNTPHETQESWTAENLVDTEAGSANATFSDVYSGGNKCFDGVPRTRWIVYAKTAWVIYKFSEATKITAYGVRQSAENGYDNRTPISWELYGSNAETPPTTVDDVSWEKIDTRTSIFHNYKGNNYDFKDRVMLLAKTAKYRTYLLKITENKGDGYTVIGELEFYYEAPSGDVTFVDGPTVSYQNGAFKVAGSFVSTADCEIKAVISDGSQETTYTVGAFSGSEAEQFIDYTIPSDLDANKTYSIKFIAPGEEVTVESGSAEFYNGTLELAKLSDAKEEGKVPAVLTISRSTADTIALNVEVLFTEGTAKEGKNYQPAQNPVVIPAGETTATFNVVPLVDVETEEDTEMTVSILGGAYKDDTPAVTVKIENRGIPTDKNVWMPTSGNLASTAANWSLGRVPTATDDVLLDGGYANEDMVWDGGENGLGDTVKSWTQTEGYTGTVTIKTKYPDANGATATALKITGDLTLDTGAWTHPANSASEEFRLKVLVGGKITIGSGVKIDASGKGFATGKARPGSEKGCHASPMGLVGVETIYGDVKKPEALGSGIGGGYEGAGGTVTINGGNIKASSIQDVRGCPTNKEAKPVYCVTVENVGDAAAIEKLPEYYGTKDIVPINGAIYLYLPNGNYEFSVNEVLYIATVKDDLAEATRLGMKVTIDGDWEHLIVEWTSGEGAVTNAVENGFFGVEAGTENVKVLFTPAHNYQFKSESEDGVRALTSPLVESCTVTAPEVEGIPGTEAAPWQVGEEVTAYVSDEGTLVIEGEGEMDDFASVEEVPWNDKAKEIKSVTIGGEVEQIGKNALAMIDDEVTVNGLALSFQKMIVVSAGVAEPVIPEGMVLVSKTEIEAAKATTIQVVDGTAYLGVSVSTNADLTAEIKNWGKVKLDLSTVKQAEDGHGLVVPVPAKADKGFMILRSGDGK